MKKISVFLFLILILSACSNRLNAEKQPVDNQQKAVVAKPEQLPTSNIVFAPEKVEIFLFHRTVRCSTCIAIGKLADKTVQEKFPEEVKSGRIVFKEINVDLPENKELAEKFQASGSALYINAIKNSRDNIEQDTKVWRLTGDEAAFVSYFENRLNLIISG